MKRILKQYQTEMVFFLLFLVELILRAPLLEELDSWCTTYYTIGYEYGFSSRLLIGSIMGILFPQLYRSILYVLLLFIAVILSLLASIVIGSFIRKVGKAQKGMALFLSVLWIASPASITYLFQTNTLGRMDTFLLIYTLTIFLLCFLKDNAVKWVAVSVLACIAVLTHQVYVFIYFPLPAAIFIYEFFEYKDKKRIIYGVLLFGLCFGLAMYLQLFSKVNCETAQEMYERAIAHNSVQDVNLTVLQFEYFGHFIDHWNTFGKGMIVDCIKTGLASLALLSPLWMFLIGIWREYIRYIEKQQRLGIYLMLACHIAYIPIFIITVDWGRWLAALFIFDFLLLFYLIGKRDRAMCRCVEEKWEKIKKNPIPYLVLISYLAMQGKFDAINVSSSAERVVCYITKWMEYIR